MNCKLGKDGKCGRAAMPASKLPWAGSVAPPPPTGWPTASCCWPLCPDRAGAADVWDWKAPLVAGFTQFVLALLRIPDPRHSARRLSIASVWVMAPFGSLFIRIIQTNSDNDQ
jgi:hypothetical protein